MDLFNRKKNNEYQIVHIPVEKIVPNPYQPRRVFDEIALEELSNSIQEYGLMQPINVRMINENYYELVAGERRLRASKLAGLKTVPAVIVQAGDQDSAILALVENLQRENLNFFEESEGFYSLIKDYGFTQEDIAKKVGKSQSTIANKLRLLKLPQEVKKILMENQLTERHARALLKIPDEKIQLEIVKKIAEQGLTVKKTEELIQRTIDEIMSEEEDVKKDRKVKRYIKDIRLFTNTVQKAVDVMKDSGVDVKYKVKKNNDFYEINIMIPNK